MESGRMSVTNSGTIMSNLKWPLIILAIGAAAYFGGKEVANMIKTRINEIDRVEARNNATRMFIYGLSLEEMRNVRSNVCSSANISEDLKTLIREKVALEEGRVANAAKTAEANEANAAKTAEANRIKTANLVELERQIGSTSYPDFTNKVEQARTGERIRDDQAGALVEKARLREVDALNTMLESTEYCVFTGTVARATADGLLKGSEAKTLVEKAYTKTLDGMLESMQKTKGVERIEMIGRIVAKFPQYDDVNELRREQLNLYSEMICPLLSTKSGDEKVNTELNKTLKGFHNWIKGQDMKYFEDSDFADLKKALGSYSRDVTKVDGKKEYRLGDRVVTKRNLGVMTEYDETRYFHGANVNEIPIGTECVVKRVIDGGQAVSVIIPSRGNRQMDFILEEIGETKVPFSVQKNMRRTTAILNYIETSRIAK